ncbi:MAG TPA: peptidoglycan editing factor PgeF [Burkholderiales bacterium]|nr:peptidoglycan editing factor PgeF [Burkholderiales bacterium]
MTNVGKPYLVAPRLAGIGWLVHGFGRAGWGEEDILDSRALCGFRPVIMRQLHSDIIHRLDREPAGRLEGDALMTDAPGLLLIVRTADCLPVLLVDGTHKAVASVHCGWRGTEKRILEKAVRAMGRAYGAEPGELLAALGPCIGSACYEVGPEVHAGFLKAGFPPDVFADSRTRRGRFLLDLRRANTWLLDGLGVKPDAIWSSDVCTHCDPALLSYRRSKGERRRMYNFIGIRDRCLKT